jgi:APA family basic amino acid/polyamine antiporter
MGLAICLLLIAYKPRFTWPGLIITLLGIPIYYLVVAKKSPAEKALLEKPEEEKIV